MLVKIAAGAVLVLVLMCSAAAATKAQQQAEVRTTSKQILSQLYKARPSVRGAVNAAAGYATFSNFGLKIFFAGGGGGSGLAVNKKTRQEFFMKMVEVQAGLGLGIKMFRVVFIFETEKAFDEFVNSGWEFGGQATAAATDGRYGGAYQGAVSVMPSVWMYQMTEKGLTVEITGKGTKYYKNDDLN